MTENHQDQVETYSSVLLFSSPHKKAVAFPREVRATWSTCSLLKEFKLNE